MKKLFNHPSFPEYAGRYYVTDDGKVINKLFDRNMKVHQSAHSGSRFVRLAGEDMAVKSFTVSRLILLTFRPEQYEEGLIAIHKKGKKDVLSNLYWGTRSDQSNVMMLKKSHRDRVVMMAKKYNGKALIPIDHSEVIRLFVKEKLTSTQIAVKMDCHILTVYSIIGTYKKVGKYGQKRKKK